MKETFSDILFRIISLPKVALSLTKQLGRQENSVTFGDFVWLLRDTHLEDVDLNNKPCTTNEYLLKVVLAPPKKASAEERLKVSDAKETLLSNFETLQAKKLPSPTSNPELLRNIGDPKVQSILSPKFTEGMDQFVRFVKSTAKTKKHVLKGDSMNGLQLRIFSQAIVNQINSKEGMPTELLSSWQAATQAVILKAEESCLALYKKEISELLPNLPMDQSLILSRHQHVYNQIVLPHFIELTKCVSANDLASTIESISQKILKYNDHVPSDGILFNLVLKPNEQKSSEKCKILLQNLKNKHLLPFLKTIAPNTTNQELKSVLKLVSSLYLSESSKLGPCADKVWKAFEEELEQMKVQYCEKLKMMKDYNEESLRRQKAESERVRLENEKARLEFLKNEEERQHRQNLLHLEGRRLAELENQKREQERKMEENKRRIEAAAKENMDKIVAMNEQEKQNLLNMKAVVEQQLAGKQWEIANLQNQVNQLQYQGGGGGGGFCTIF